MRLLYHPHSSDISLAGVLYALGDPLRLKIVARLATEGELGCAELECSIARSTMSHHFKILRESGVVQTRKEGTQHLNSLRRAEIDRRFPGLLAAVLQAQANETEASVASVKPV
jgi:DNA-binding transcriptional ArsR family regulator